MAFPLSAIYCDWTLSLFSAVSQRTFSWLNMVLVYKFKIYFSYTEWHAGQTLRIFWAKLSSLKELSFSKELFLATSLQFSGFLVCTCWIDIRHFLNFTVGYKITQKLIMRIAIVAFFFPICYTRNIIHCWWICLSCCLFLAENKIVFYLIILILSTCRSYIKPKMQDKKENRNDTYCKY